MGKKVKFKVKKGKLKVKLKSGEDGVLALSEANIRGLLVLAMASAVEPRALDAERLLTGGEMLASTPLLIPGNVPSDEQPSDTLESLAEN